MLRDLTKNWCGRIMMRIPCIQLLIAANNNISNLFWKVEVNLENNFDRIRNIIFGLKVSTIKKEGI